MKKMWIGMGMACLLALAGCGGSETAKKETAASTPAGGGGIATPDEINGATVTGKVSFTGDKPVMRTLDMSATPFCTRAHPNGQKSEDVVLGDNGALKNVFVWIKSGLPDKEWAVPTTSVSLDQNGCMYKPHVLGVMAGQNIDIKNSDQTDHNIHPQPQTNQDWNQSQAPGTPAMTKSFARQEVMIPVKCNIHPWMRSYIGVVSHPFFAVTGDDGSYTIKGLPPGTYTLEFWQEKYGPQDQQITVGAKESKTVDYAFKG